MSVQVSYKRQISFGILLLLCLLAAIEITARIYEFFYPYCSIIHRDALNEINWYTVRWICIDTNLLEYEWPDIQRYVPDQHLHTININSLGFRGEEFTREKSDNVYRIFIVGGSSTFGYGSSGDEYTIPGQLGTIFKDRNVEVINSGIGGATSFEEKYLIEKNIVNLEPNMIIIFDGGNDVRYDQPSLKNYSDQKEKNPLKFGNYKFYRTPFVIWENFLRFNHDDSKIPSSKIIQLDDVPITANWKHNVLDICNISNKNNITTVVLIQPLLGSGTKILAQDESEFFNNDREKFTRNLKRLNDLSESSHDLEEICSDVHDLRDIFKDINEPVFLDDIHLNENGNYLVAKRISQIIGSYIDNHNDK